MTVDPRIVTASELFEPLQPLPPFTPFPKIPRLRRGMVITEKIDGTNAQIYISEDKKTVEAGSRNRWITPKDDNYGFATWVMQNRHELVNLGPGHHFGEWWGPGIQRGYGLTQKKFSLFNTHRWGEGGKCTPPACCDVVPVIYSGEFSDDAIKASLDDLRNRGSRVSPGFMRPEGIVIYLPQANALFKVLLENDELPKGLVEAGRE